MRRTLKTTRIGALTSGENKMTKNSQEYLRNEAYFRRLLERSRARILLRTVLDAAANNFMLTFIVALVFTVVMKAFNALPTTPGLYLCAILVIALLATAVSVLLAKFDPYDAEKRIDENFCLDERCVTASELLTATKNREPSEFELLQMNDSFQRVAKIAPQDVVPIRPQRYRAKCLVLAICAALTSLVAFASLNGDAMAFTPNETVVDVVQELREQIIPAIEELAQQNPENVELQNLRDALAQGAELIEQNSDDPKQGLAVVAQLEQKMQATIDSLGIEATDAGLKALGDALYASEMTRAIANAFAEGDYDKAADELEKLDFEKMTARDRQALAEKLRSAAEIMRSRKDEQTAKLTEQLADELQSGKCASCKNTACKLANKARTQKANKQTAKQLDCQMARLGLCKSNCAGACANCQMGCASAQNNSDANADKQKGGAKDAGQQAQTKSADGSNGKPLQSSNLAVDALAGKDANLETQRQLTKIEGQENEEGETSVERAQTDSADAQAAALEYDLDEREYARQLEKALDDDNIPIERRQVARDYFESLRILQQRQQQQ